MAMLLEHLYLCEQLQQVVGSLSLSYQRRLGWACKRRFQPTQAFFTFGVTLMMKYNLQSVTEYNSVYTIVGVIPKEGLDGLVSSNPSFGMTTTKILRPVSA